MTDTANIARQFEEIKLAIENGDDNSLLTMWIPIIVVFIGAAIAHIFTLIEKKRQRENLKNTVVIWLKESLPSIGGFLGVLKNFIDESKSATVLMPRQLSGPMLNLQYIKEFPIDKMSDALVAGLKINRKEEAILIHNFYELYNSTNIFIVAHAKWVDGLSDYSKEIGDLMQHSNERLIEFARLTKHYHLSTDLSESEQQFFDDVDGSIFEFSKQLEASRGAFRRDAMLGVIHNISDTLLKTTFTQRVSEVHTSFLKFKSALLAIEDIYQQSIWMSQSTFKVISPSQKALSNVLSFYESHKTKGIFSLSNKVT